MVYWKQGEWLATALMNTAVMLASVRPSLGYVRQVKYKVPGFLHGTYMLQKRGCITEGDLIRHAIHMRYGDTDSMLAGDLSLDIKVIEVR